MASRYVLIQANQLKVNTKVTNT